LAGLSPWVSQKPIISPAFVWADNLTGVRIYNKNETTGKCPAKGIIFLNLGFGIISINGQR